MLPFPGEQRDGSLTFTSTLPSAAVARDQTPVKMIIQVVFLRSCPDLTVVCSASQLLGGGDLFLMSHARRKLLARPGS